MEAVFDFNQIYFLFRTHIFSKIRKKPQQNTAAVYFIFHPYKIYLSH
ncbi:MAG: hypothetical protein JG782_693 [Anaerophaga sp.]|nr:hypothetical protein [Anaerophaga sp.]MDI3520624.1 hypothetical protein [Anaerophaga sp.]